MQAFGVLVPCPLLLPNSYLFLFISISLAYIDDINSLIPTSSSEKQRCFSFVFCQYELLFSNIDIIPTKTISKTNNPLLVDRCLSHSQQSIMARYMSFSYESREEVFEKYWDIVRG